MASLARHALCFTACLLLLLYFTDATETCDFKSATYGPYIEDIVERVMIGLPQQSFSDCVKKCALRPWCKLLGYHRMAKVCELYFDDLTVLEHISAFDGNPNTMMYIRRKDLNTQDREKCDEMCPYNPTSLLQTCDFASETKCPIDVCPPFDKAAQTNGIILGNMHMEGHRRRLECNHGYLPLDLNNVTSHCQNGRWTNVTTCVQVCPQFENKRLHSEMVGDSIYENATRNLTCNQGYMPLDPAKTVSKCTKGHWTEMTECVLVCPKFEDINNGRVVGDSIYENATRNLTCNKNYSALDPAKTVSQCTKGNWTNITKCIRVCPKFEDINNGRVVGDSIFENATRNLTCDKDYSPLDPAKTVSQCTKGNWTNITKCIRALNWSDSYYLFTEYKEGAFDNAMKRCTNCGGHLIIIDDEKEHDWIKSQKSYLTDVQRFWLGVTQEKNTRIIISAHNNSIVSYVPWGNEEPNSLDDICVCAESGMDWAYNDVTCYHTCSVICKLHN